MMTPKVKKERSGGSEALLRSRDRLRQAAASRPNYEARLTMWVFGMEQSMAWFTGVHVTGWSVKRQEAGWLLVVTAEKNSDAVVAFYHCARVVDCFETLAAHVKSNRVNWRPDKYRGSRGGEPGSGG